MAVGRFQVMAMLQAARAFELGLPLESAHSWGLNRAIFYAAAKRGFKGGGTGSGSGGEDRTGAREAKADEFHLGDDLAFKEPGSSDKSPALPQGDARVAERFLLGYLQAKAGRVRGEVDRAERLCSHEDHQEKEESLWQVSPGRGYWERCCTSQESSRFVVEIGSQSFLPIKAMFPPACPSPIGTLSSRLLSSNRSGAGNIASTNAEGERPPDW